MFAKLLGTAGSLLIDTVKVIEIYILFRYSSLDSEDYWDNNFFI